MGYWDTKSAQSTLENLTYQLARIANSLEELTLLAKTGQNSGDGSNTPAASEEGTDEAFH